jgi:hypothetical protein
MDTESDDAILFFSEEREGENSIDHYSVPSPPSRKSRSQVIDNRAIVAHEMGSTKTGQWSCSRDRGTLTHCTHIHRAKYHAKRLESDNSNEPGLADLEEPEDPADQPPGNGTVNGIHFTS